MKYTEVPRHPPPPWDVDRVTDDDREMGLLWGELFRVKREVSGLERQLVAHLSGVSARDLRDMEAGRLRFVSRALLAKWELWLGAQARCMAPGCERVQFANDLCNSHNSLKHRRAQARA